jgi:hypothetical protein
VLSETLKNLAIDVVPVGIATDPISEVPGVERHAGNDSSIVVLSFLSGDVRFEMGRNITLPLRRYKTSQFEEVHKHPHNCHITRSVVWRSPVSRTPATMLAKPFQHRTVNVSHSDFT